MLIIAIGIIHLFSPIGKMKILTSIEEIIDPRMIGKVQHNLSTIIFVALCGILSGCEDWKDISDYCSCLLYTSDAADE